MTNQEKIIQLLGAGLSVNETRKQVGCSDQCVYRCKRKHRAEIEELKKKNLQPPPPPPKPPKQPQPITKTTVVLVEPSKAENPLNLEMPVLDPTKDPASQLAPLAWKVLAIGAAGTPISKSQRDMAMGIIKASERHRVPPAVNRKLRFHVDEIDIVGTEFQVTEEQIYEVKV